MLASTLRSWNLLNFPSGSTAVELGSSGSSPLCAEVRSCRAQTGGFRLGPTRDISHDLRHCPASQNSKLRFSDPAGSVQMRTATCSCGQLSITSSGEPSLVALCHCLACQKRTGSTYGIAAFFPREAISKNGTAKQFTRQSDSGYEITFHFCPECGSNVYWEPHRRPELVAIAVGSFADPAFPAPTKEVFTAHRHLWLASSGLPDRSEP